MPKDLTDKQIPKGRKVEFVDVWTAKNRVHRSGEKFAAALNEIGKNLEGNLNLFTKQVALKIFTGIIQGNPVDTGYSRVNWHFGQTPNLSIIGKPPVEGSTILPRPLTQDASKQAGIGSTYYMNNNLPYISALESGSSNQAPTGFIANTLFRVAKDVQRSKKK